MIWNSHGKIIFEEPVDLRNLNLERLIKISHRVIDIYPAEEGI